MRRQVDTQKIYVDTFTQMWDSKKSVICFVGLHSCPRYFVEAVLFHAQKQGISITRINAADTDLAKVRMDLETTFLGNTTTYWLYGLENLSDKNSTLWRTYLEKYAGPHTIICNFDCAVNVKQWHCIPTEKMLNRHAFLQLTGFLNENEKSAQAFANELFMHCSEISFEQGCILSQYADLIGMSHDQFFSHWLERLCTFDVSLFRITHHFFSQDKRSFYELWLRIAQIYPAPFWTIFWSERIWAAIIYIDYQKAGDKKRAQGITRKLPFSFIQRSWQKYASTTLVKAHNRLYQVDNALKNGASIMMLELFFEEFFAQSF